MCVVSAFTKLANPWVDVTWCPIGDVCAREERVSVCLWVQNIHISTLLGMHLFCSGLLPLMLLHLMPQVSGRRQLCHQRLRRGVASRKQSRTCTKQTQNSPPTMREKGQATANTHQSGGVKRKWTEASLVLGEELPMQICSYIQRVEDKSTYIQCPQG